MSLFPTDDPAHKAALAALQEGDTAVLYVERRTEAYTRSAEITKATPAYLWVGSIKFHRKNGMPPRERKSAAVRFRLYGMTEAAKAYFEERARERQRRIQAYEERRNGRT